MEIIYTPDAIAQRVRSLGDEITAFYRDREPLTLVALLTGAIPFAADLMRAIDLPIRVDSLCVASYHNCKSCGELQFRSSLKLPVADRHVLIVDEVLDSGVTLAGVAEYFRNHGALSVRTAVMVEKELPRPNGVAHADWVGFVMADRYLVGYGLDADEEYRNLPYIAAL